MDQIVEAAGSTRKSVIVDAICMLREYILRCQLGYYEEYGRADEPNKVIQVESKYD